MEGKPFWIEWSVPGPHLRHNTNPAVALDGGDPSAAGQLLPIVYEELRRLATAKLRQEKCGQTLQATALVHEAYLRLVDLEQAQHWDSRGHFFKAAAEVLGISLRTAKRHWTYARTWLHRDLR